MRPLILLALLAGCTWPDRPAATAPGLAPSGPVMVAQPSSAAEAVSNAQLARSQGQMARYVEWVQLALKLDPNYQPALAALGVVQAAAGDYRAAATTLTRACQMNPQDIEARLNLAEATWRLGDPQTALSEILQIEKQQPANPRAFYLEACVHVTSQRDDLALNRFTHAYNLSMDASILLQRALVHQRMGHGPLARYDFEQVLNQASDPNTLEQARRGLAALSGR